MKWLAYLRTFFLPTLCPVCGGEIGSARELMCPQCYARLPRFVMTSERDNSLLRRLWTEADVLAGGSVFHYKHTSPFHKLLTRIKYDGDIDLARRMGTWGARVLGVEQWQERIDAVIPVPMNRRRIRYYGYNQCLYLALGIADELRCPVVDCLTRCDTLSSQTRLRRDERLSRDIAVTAYIPDLLRGRTILLVDDVITTGATLRRCVRALLEADASLRICVFTLASAGPHHLTN